MIEPVNTPIIQDLSYKPVTITIDNVYMRIDGMDQDEEIELWKQLSFKVEIYGQQQVYWRHLFNRKTKKSYAGLFNYVKEFLDEREIPIKLIDHRINNPTMANFSLVEYIDDAKTIKLEPRLYQKSIIDNCPNRTIIQAATGAGKTFMMAALIAKFNVKPVCVFADKIGLCTQLKEEFEKFLGVEVGLVGDGIEDYKDITVISLQSAKEEYIKNANMIMFDECHHIPSQTCVDVANKCQNAYYRIGVSATPWRDSGDELLIEAVLSKRNNDMNINASKLIKLGYLIKPSIFFVPIHETFADKNYHKLYDKAITNNLNRNKIVTKIVNKMYGFNKHILVLFKIIKHGEILRDMIVESLGGEEFQTVTIENPKTGKQMLVRVSNVEILSGKDKSTRRAAVLKSVKEGFTKVLLASTIADEGLDLPILDCLVLAGSGKSSTRAFQRVGRVLRLAEGKTKAIVFDFMDATPMLKRHSNVRKKLYKTEPEWEIGEFNVLPD